MQHPVYNVPLTDRLGNEINEGDTVLVPIRHYDGLGSARLIESRIGRIDPLVERSGRWLPTGSSSRIPWVRIDQQGRKKATEFFPPKGDFSKASVLSTRPNSPNGGVVTIRYNDCVRVATCDTLI